MTDQKDVLEKIKLAFAGSDQVDDDGFEAMMMQIEPLMAEINDEDTFSQVMSLIQQASEVRITNSLKEMGVSDADIAKSQSAMEEAQDSLAAERYETPDEILQVFHAIDEDDTDALRAALENADINCTMGQYEKTPLYAAMSSFGPCAPVIALLLDHGADPNRGLSGGTNVLHGIGFGRYDDWTEEDVDALVARCIQAGADIEARTDHLGWTPLHTAISEWEPKTARALLVNGADANALMGVTDPPTFNNGGTALQMVQSQPDLVELLLSFGADPLMPNACGQTSMDAVRESAEDDSSFGRDCARSLVLMEARAAVN
jgi:hypothetical protein